MNFSSPNNLFPIINIVNIFFIISCSFIKPSDPNFRAKAFYNEQHSGFIAKDFFQVRVVTHLTVKEIPLLEKRNDCKRRSYALRNELAVPLLITELKEMDSDRLKGINRIRKMYAPKDQQTNNQLSSTSSFPPSTSVPNPLVPLSQAQQNRSQQDIPSITNAQNLPTEDMEYETKSEALFKPRMEYLQSEFAWLLDEMVLFKEDYSEKEKCIFIYRAAKKGLYDKLERTNLSVDWEQLP